MYSPFPVLQPTVSGYCELARIGDAVRDSKQCSHLICIALQGLCFPKALCSTAALQVHVKYISLYLNGLNEALVVVVVDIDMTINKVTNASTASFSQITKR